MSGLDVLYWEANTSDFPNNLRRKASRPMASHEFAHGMVSIQYYYDNKPFLNEIIL